MNSVELLTAEQFVPRLNTEGLSRVVPVRWDGELHSLQPLRLKISMKKDFLIEIGTEEIPASYLEPGL
ncbi:MAG: hypothetical protein Q7J55_06150, partial [bacterium]|nr:hypothetical protein [bacterium]